MSGSIEQEEFVELQNPNEFEKLVADVKRILGPSSGIDATDIDTNALMEVLANYKSDPSHWEKFAFGDSSMGYTRNGVSTINSKANLLVLVWTPGKGSAIHDHANAHCIVKVLKGSLRETMFRLAALENVSSSDTGENQSAATPALSVAKITDVNTNEVTYMSDKLGLHSMANLGTDYAVSLHLYTPPWATKFGCHIYDPKGGKKQLVSMSTLYSDKGVKIADQH